MYVKVDYPARSCDVCGKEFKPTSSKHITCSRACKGRKPKGAMRGPFTCQCCGKQYETRRPKGEGETFCSRECGFEYLHKHGRPERRKPDSPPKYCAVHYPTCMACGSVFMSRRENTETCSDECRRRHLASKARQVEAAKKEVKQRQCKECGSVFVPAYGDKRRGFCSHACARTHGRRIGKASRRARQRSGRTADSLDPIAVFDRDGWSCQICGCDTPKELRGSTHDDAPELDHIVPLSRDGAHTWANVQCACRLCNIMKGAKTMDEFKQWNQVDRGRGVPILPTLPQEGGGQVKLSPPRN